MQTAHNLLVFMHVVSEGAICRCIMKYVYIKIVQNSKENTCAGVSFK